MRIELSCDAGESYGSWPMGEDETLIPLVSAVNIACAAHAGDPVTMERTIALALEASVVVGAHPGYPDRDGFGRRDLAMSAIELEASLLFQVSALQGMARAAGAEVRHVKAHGALYNAATRDPLLATTIARAVRRASAELVVVGPPGSALLVAASTAGLATQAEGFADRAYEADGSLRPRSLPGALLQDPSAAAAQALVLAATGRYGTLCI
ncbi:MAG: 5-oxoprolinase subunit PxpA, partial [Gaiellales bacterium]